jgi:ATP-binding cassette subfamily A (ABC1) protein 5
MNAMSESFKLSSLFEWYKLKIYAIRIINALNISEHADKKSVKLSGGTKRKLSFALATFASPNIALLDEPSTGMDPQSKRTFW